MTVRVLAFEQIMSYTIPVVNIMFMANGVEPPRIQFSNFVHTIAVKLHAKVC